MISDILGNKIIKNKTTQGLDFFFWVNQVLQKDNCMESTEKLIEQDVSQENSKDYLVNFDTIPLKDNEYINQEKQIKKI